MGVVSRRAVEALAPNNINITSTCTERKYLEKDQLLIMNMKNIVHHARNFEL